MKFSRILIVFLMIWKETFSYPIDPDNNLHERGKRYNERDHDDNLAHVTQVKNKMLKKNIPIGPINPTNAGQQTQGTRTDLSLLNKVPTKTPRRNIVRVNPLNKNTKSIRNIRKPFVLVENLNLKDKRNVELSKVNDTLTDQALEVKKVEEKVLVDKIVDTMAVDNTLSSESDLHEIFGKPSEETATIKSEEPQTVTSKTKSKTSKKESKSRKSFAIKSNKDSELKTSIVPQEPDKHSKKYKPISVTELDTVSEKEQDEMVDAENVKDISIKEDLEIKSVQTEEDKTQLEAHPVLKLIESDINTCRTTKEPTDSTDKIEKSKDDDNLEIVEKSAFDLDTLHKLSQETDDNDEVEGLIIKNKNYEEVVEITRPANVPGWYKMNKAQDNTVQGNTIPVSYNKYYQQPYSNYYQETKPELDLNYQNDNPYVPDYHQTEQIDGKTVVSYNNYFKMPTTNRNPNYNRYGNPHQNSNQNRYNGYVPVRPRQTSNCGCAYHRRFENQNAGEIERIWKTWKNTEYFLRSKNALKQIDYDQFYNMINQNNDNKIKYIQSRNVGNGNYQRQNISP